MSVQVGFTEFIQLSPAYSLFDAPLAAGELKLHVCRDLRSHSSIYNTIPCAFSVGFRNADGVCWRTR